MKTKKILRAFIKLILCVLLWTLFMGTNELFQIIALNVIFDLKISTMMAYIVLIALLAFPTVRLFPKNKLAIAYVPIQYVCLYLFHSFVWDLSSGVIGYGYDLLDKPDYVFMALLTAEICVWIVLILGIHMLLSAIINFAKQKITKHK